MKFCGRPLASRSKYSGKALHRCFRPIDHPGRCDEYPYLAHLARVAPKVKNKIVRDSIMTTGAAWKSEDAGPNRIRRWVMLKSDAELLAYGIDMRKLKAQVVAKLREKAAPYDACMAVAQKLTALVYEMAGAPEPPEQIREYLESMFGPMKTGATSCLVCLAPLEFGLFAEARRGKAEIETSHSNPRLHTPENVGFAHRPCNIAQGDKTLDEFYAWISAILERAVAMGKYRSA